MSDLIDRQHAIDEIRFYITEPDISDDEIKIEGYNDGLEMAISILSILASAEPERKKGEWIDGKPYVNSHWLVCSICHETSPDGSRYNFCPNCGVEMRGGNETY